MKKSFLVISILFTCIIQSQTPEQILKIDYKLIPISQYYFNHDASTPEEERTFDIALRSGYNFQYSLLFDLKTRRSIFNLDTLIVTKVKGKEDYWTDPENKIKFCITNSDGTYTRKEHLFDQEILIKGNKSSVQWEITNEFKEILGYECTKAVSKDKDMLFTVWFTKEIPIQTGPSLFNNLPGVVLWAEDYFSTISVTKISYQNNKKNYDKLEQIIQNQISKDKDDIIEENIFLLKKSDLVNQLR